MHRCLEVEVLRVVVLVLREEELRLAERGLVEEGHRGDRGISVDERRVMSLWCGYVGVNTGVQGKKGITWHIAN